MATTGYGYQNEDDDDLASAFFGNSQQQPAGTPTTGTPGTAFTSPTGPNLADAMGLGGGGGQQPQQQTNALAQGSQAYGGGDLAGAIFGGQQQPQQPTGSQPGGNLADAIGTKAPGTADTGTRTPSTGGDVARVDPVERYRTQVSDLANITDPTELARARDGLKRNLFSELSAAGNQVKWDGETLVVNGLRYNVAGSQGPNTGTGENWLPNGGVNGTPQLQQDGAPAAGRNQRFASEGFEDSKYGKDDPKYIFQRIAEQYDWNDPAQRDAALQALRSDPSGYFANATLDGDILTHGSTDPIYNGIAQFDIQRDTENGGPLQWAPVGQGGGGGAQGLPPSIFGIDAPGAAGVQTGGVPGGGVPSASGAPNPAFPDFLTGLEGYTPGAIGDEDIPDVDPSAVLGQMGGYTPERYDVGDLDVGAVDDQTEGLVSSLLDSPESLNAQAVARMEVGGRESAATSEQQDLAELEAMAQEGGFAGSPFVASQRLARRGQTNEQIQRNNREIEIEAARTNMADRRAAAGVGSSFLSERGTRQRGNEALRQSASAQNNQNLFNAANLQSNNVVQSTKLALDAASQRGDRMALRESVRQRAAELGIDSAKLMADYATSVRDDLTRRYNIDVDAQLRQQGISVDWAKLSQSGEQFQQELMFKLQQLAQQREVDLSGIGLGYAKLDNDRYMGELGAMQDAIFG